MKIFVGILAVGLCYAQGATAATLNLGQGRMSVGGSLTANYQTRFPDIGDSVSGMEFRVAPTFGYLLMEHVEVFGGFLYGAFSGDLFAGSPTSVGVVGGANYYLPAGEGLTGYFGLAVGGNFVTPEDADTVRSLTFAVPGGVLVALTDDVALDLGLRVQYELSLEEAGDSFLRIPMGYFGVKAFF